MNWLKVHQRTAWTCGLTLLLPVLLYLSAFFGMWGARQASLAEIHRLEPRIARMQGLIQNESRLREAAVAVDSQVMGLVYPATEERAAVAAILQTNVRDIFTKAGLSVTNSLVLPVRERGNFDYIGIKLTVSGELSELDEALVGIAEYLPLLLIESIDVAPARVPRVRASRNAKAAPVERQVITASLQLLSLRAVQ
ncbi:MAG: general secretion pathway protein GspM [Halioglobus sp.]|nr:general secretion pathway protein GspM [Halioglobus sp.]